MLQREIVNEEIKIPYTVLDSINIFKVAFAINVQLTLNAPNEQGPARNSLHVTFLSFYPKGMHAINYA